MDKSCKKCGGKEVEVNKIATTGAGVSRYLNLQHNQFKAVSCKKCGYTEMYKTNSSTTENIVDLFLGR